VHQRVVAVALAPVVVVHVRHLGAGGGGGEAHGQGGGARERGEGGAPRGGEGGWPHPFTPGVAEARLRDRARRRPKATRATDDVASTVHVTSPSAPIAQLPHPPQPLPPSSQYWLKRVAVAAGVPHWSTEMGPTLSTSS